MAKRYDINSITGTEFTYQLYANMNPQISGETTVACNATATGDEDVVSFDYAGGGGYTLEYLSSLTYPLYQMIISKAGSPTAVLNILVTYFVDEFDPGTVIVNNNTTTPVPVGDASSYLLTTDKSSYYKLYEDGVLRLTTTAYQAVCPEVGVNPIGPLSNITFAGVCS